MVEKVLTDLIEIRPSCELEGQCPHCHSEGIGTESIFFQGIHILAQCTCLDCRHKFMHSLPVGHDLSFPTSFDENGNILKADGAALVWLVDPLRRSMFRGDQTTINIEKEIFQRKKEAVILNCLDNCFGHVFSKLWNASILTEKYKDKSIIVFIPKKMRWMVPEGVSEIWSFDAPLSDLSRLILNLDQEVKNLMTVFDKVWLSKAYTFLDLNRVDLEGMIKTRRFDLAKFSSLPPVVTFALRDDRFWQSSRVEFFLFKVCVKLNLPKKLFRWRQHYLINQTARLIKKDLHLISFNAVGLGKNGGLSKFINDHRKRELTEEEELQWCHLYANTHLVIGVHGSNMLIPSALSAGFIEILPRYKIKHISEDTLLDYNSRYSHFLGRHLDQYASPGLVAAHAVSIIQDFPYVYRQTNQRV